MSGKDLDKLQGTWNITSLEMDCESMAVPAFEGAHIIVDGNRFVSLGMGAAYEGTIELLSTKKPKAFDLLFTKGHATGTRNLGIYKLDGDRWTICLATYGDRPGVFATHPKSGWALETLERNGTVRSTGKAKAKQTTVVPEGPATILEGEWAMVSAVFNGVAMAENMVQWCKRITRGNVTSVVAGPQVMLRASFTLDPSKQPSAVDYINLEGANKGKAQAGIFALNGDSLEICMAAPGKPRPENFTSKPGDGRSFTTWRLVQ